jgi:predicted membrane-bound mannosyltransferase
MGKKKKAQAVVPDWDSKPEERTKLGFYFLLFAIALIPRLLHLLMISDNPFFNFPIIDCQVNNSWGESIAAGQWLGRGPFWQAPLYPYFLGIIYTILGHDLFLARLVQIILGSVNCLLLYRIAKTAFNPKVALVSFLIAAFYGPFILFENELLNPVLMIFFNLLALLILFSYLHRPSWVKLLLAGIILGLSTITHGMAVTIVPFALLWTIIILAKRKSSIPKMLASCLVLLAGFLLILSLTTVRNLVVGEDFVIVSSNTGINFFIGNNPDYQKTTTIRPGMEWEELIQRPMQEGFEKPSQRSAFFFNQTF